ncbi:dsRNA-binding protein 3 [Prunus dulcis]|uniref:DsRNA-binding protein 3 n=1 Tax=Prunus dulcis TaxID=3755 RepID=A0A4Y1RRT2_PRUDU|nr:dsRNA-binding protein 3 [Prunus dulcis]
MLSNYLSQSPANVHEFLSLLQQFSERLIGVKAIHSQIITISIFKNQILATKLVKAYSDLGSLVDARHVFDQFFHPITILCNAMIYGDVVCWNSMIGGYVQSSHFSKAIDMFLEMCSCGVAKSSHYVQHNSSLHERWDFKLGKCVHGCIVRLGMGNEVRTSLIDMHSNMGEMQSACWFSRPCRQEIWFHGILVTSDGRFDFETMVSLVQGCSQTADLESGKILHCCAFRRGFDLNRFFPLPLMKERNVITWTAMLVGLAQNGHAEEALKRFCQMREEGIAANSVTLVSLFHSCFHLGSLKKGRSVHGNLIRHVHAFGVVNMTALWKERNRRIFQGHIGVRVEELWDRIKFWASLWASVLGQFKDYHYSTIMRDMMAFFFNLSRSDSLFLVFLFDQGFFLLIINTMFLFKKNMYAKCGKIKYSERIFENCSICGDVILWNSMITSYGIHGYGLQALGIYRRMKDEGFKPNETSFLSLLTACSHSGLVEEGIKLFHSMERDPDIALMEKHYAGRFEEAEALMEQMPYKPGNYVLEALLNGCHAHKNIDLGLLCIDSMNPGIYVVLSNIYAQARRWDSVNYIQSHTRTKGLKKTPGCSLIEVGHQHLENLRVVVEASDYVPDTSGVLRDVDEPAKVRLQWDHSERLAIAFGLLSTPAGSLNHKESASPVCKLIPTRIAAKSRPEAEVLIFLVSKSMYKNQLQELAQRSCFNLPSYSCIREGPDHAPRFKATVNFNGETFESPTFCSTLRQAEHAAAEVALSTLAKRGPSRALAARVLDETGVYKNLLQETAHRAGLNLPVYTTVRSGPGHVPVFSCTVELAGMSFMGEPSRTKKQAQKNAAMAAWTALKRLAGRGSTSSAESRGNEEQEQPSESKNTQSDRRHGQQTYIPIYNKSTLPSPSLYPMQFQNWAYSNYSPMYELWQQEQLLQQQNRLLPFPVSLATPSIPQMFPFMQSVLHPDHCLYFPARGQQSTSAGPRITIATSGPSFCFSNHLVPNPIRGKSTVTIQEIQEEKPEESPEYSPSVVSDPFSPGNSGTELRIQEQVQDEKQNLAELGSKVGRLQLECNPTGQFGWPHPRMMDPSFKPVDFGLQRPHGFDSCRPNLRPQNPPRVSTPISLRPQFAADPVIMRTVRPTSSLGSRPQNFPSSIPAPQE